jgi:general secretion pathway protein D
MDIPVLGSLFSNTRDNTVRTELLVFITPKVVETDDELRALSVEMRDRMQGITDFSDVPIDLESRSE